MCGKALPLTVMLFFIAFTPAEAASPQEKRGKVLALYNCAKCHSVDKVSPSPVKIAPPFRVAEFDIMYNEGISKTGDVLDLAVEHGIVGKSGAWFDYKEGKIGQGREAAKVYLKENPKVLDEIEKTVRKKVTEAEA